MERPFVHRGKVVEGVHQRCNDNCPEDACKSRHKWEYTVELRSLYSERRRIKKGGFASGVLAAEARAEIRVFEFDRVSWSSARSE